MNNICIILLVTILVVWLLVRNKDNFNDLADWFYNKEKKLSVHKWEHYFDIYDKHFSRFRDKRPNILEIGVSGGGSLEMWNHYFDGKCNIYGVDIDRNCKKHENMFNNVEIIIGDQEDKTFWKTFKSKYPKMDIILDDGGHTMKQQINSFEEMYDHVSDNGVYMVEDTHTSYWSSYGSGLRNPNSFIEYAKKQIDGLNAYHITDKSIPLDFRKKTNSINFYDSIVVYEKRRDDKVPNALVKS